MDSKLREKLEGVLSGEVHYLTFFRSLEHESPKDVIELCREIIGEISYDENPDVVKAAFTQLAHLRDIESYPALEALRGIWKSTYHREYEYLIALFENAASGQDCNCNVYQDGRFNAPPYQSDLERIGHHTREYNEHMKTELIYVKCKICKKEWEVEIDHSYHYPHSHWRRKGKIG